MTVILVHHKGNWYAHIVAKESCFVDNGGGGGLGGAQIGSG